MAPIGPPSRSRRRWIDDSKGHEDHHDGEVVMVTTATNAMTMTINDGALRWA